MNAASEASPRTPSDACLDGMRDVFAPSVISLERVKPEAMHLEL